MGAVTRILGEHDSEEQAIQAAEEYIDEQMTRETIRYLKTWGRLVRALG